MIKASRWIQVVAVAALLSAGCASIGGPATGNVASAVRTASSASPTAPAPSPSPIQTSTPRLALVTLRGSDAYVVRDVTDISHPRTIGNLGTIAAPQFVSATEVSYATDTGLFRMPLSGFPKTLVVKNGGGGEWSPDGRAVVYATASSTDPYTGTITVHQFKGGHDQVLGSMRNTGGGGCEDFASCSLPNWLDFQLSYSPDGTLISLVVDSFSGTVYRIWTSSGTLLKSSDGQGATMSTWSGPSLYFRDAKGVEVWRGRVVSSFLPSVAWIKPKGSSAGGQVVYTLRDSSGWGHTYLVDTATGKSRELKSHRTDAVFLTSRYVWYRGERACVAAEQCGATPQTHPLSGKTYIYDLQDGTETESIITSVSDVWPHAT